MRTIIVLFPLEQKVGLNTSLVFLEKIVEQIVDLQREIIILL